MIKLGQEVRDRITGFSGVVLARTEWINGCARIMVQPKIDKDGKIPEIHQFDEHQLEVTGPGTYHGMNGSAEPEEATPPEVKQTGGPAPMPSRNSI